MKQQLIPYKYIIFFLLFSQGIFSQSLHLKIIAKDSIENVFLSTVNYQKKHQNKASICFEVDKISTQLKRFGFFTNMINGIVKKDSIYTARFILGRKTTKAVINISEGFKVEDLRFKIKDNRITIPIKDLSAFLESVTHQLEQKGKSFSDAKLKKIILKENTLFATLAIHSSKKRTIDKIIVKGYEQFPKSYLKHYLNIKKGIVFNRKKLHDISLSINTLNFVSEIKPPEVLFSKDSTLLYVYLKKETKNSFEGFLNFASKETGSGILLNGHINLDLTNLLNYGENINFYWNSIGEEKQEVQLSSRIPYVFKSPFSLKTSFTLYKQDSTFINTRFKGKLSYSLNRETNLSLTFNKENSNDLLQNSNTINSFKNTFIGLLFSYKKPKNDLFKNNIFFIRLNPSIGNRISNNKKTHQFKIDFESSFLWSISNRSSIYIRNKSGYLNSDKYLDNELYRIGGINSIRGYNEQSIFTSQYSFLNTEYRYLTSKESYIYSITDLGRYKFTRMKNLFSFGIGYLFKISNSQINIGYIFTESSNSINNAKNHKILLNIVSFF